MNPLSQDCSQLQREMLQQRRREREREREREFCVLFFGASFSSWVF